MKLNLFSPVNLSHVNLIIWPAKEPRREERKIFPPVQWVLIIVVNKTTMAAALIEITLGVGKKIDNKQVNNK